MRAVVAEEEKLDPSKQRQQLVDSSRQVLMAKIGKGTVKEIENVTGDIVWSDEKQAGYIRVKGLPKNDVNKNTYQLWIFEENQGTKTPIDGGTFDINSDGEVIIPIDPKLKAKFADEKLLKDSKIDVDTNNHIVTLKGTVGSDAAKKRAATIAQGTEGVVNVVNQVVVKAK